MPDNHDKSPSGNPNTMMPLRRGEGANRPSVCYVSTIAWPLNVFMGPHIRKIAENCQVTLVAQEISKELPDLFGSSVALRDLSIQRKISPARDVVALFRLWMLFRRERFDCVHSFLPKAGLLSMLAASVAGVPVRFHTFTGQVWATRSGIARRVLMLMDWLIARLATQVLTDAPSQRAFLIANKIVRPEKIEVLGVGSTVGIDSLRFFPDQSRRDRIRLELGIGSTDIVFIFVGRLTKDKGIHDLLKAFAQIAAQAPAAHLLLIGPDEEGYDIHFETLHVELRRKIHRIVGFMSQPEWYMAAADVFCLPSYREGFGSVLIEAAAVGLPAVASRIYGITDAVVDRETGILHEPGNISEIVAAMFKMVNDESLRLKMADAARTRVIEDFPQARLIAAFEAFYRRYGILGWDERT